MSHNYPDTVAEVLDDAMSFRPTTLEAVQAFADSKPWSGTVEERQRKFRRLNRALAAVYQIAEPELTFEHLDGGTSGRSHYIVSLHRIVLVGKLSVVSYLHEFGHAMGYSERMACTWSINLFRRIFPRQFSRLVQVGHMLVRPETIRRSSLHRSSDGPAATPTLTDK